MSLTGLSSAVEPIPQVTSFPTVDSFYLAGVFLPGKWTLQSAPKVFGWQQVMGWGLSGGFLISKGDPLVQAKFRGEFWANADFAQYKLIRQTLLSKPVVSISAKLPTLAMGINHPELVAMGVQSVVVQEIGPAIQEDGGLWTVTLSLLQYRKQTPAPAKPSQTTPDVAKKFPTPKTALQIEQEKVTQNIDAMRKQIANIP